jgi:septal ring factor EnvC (AmiA/AmiB activator)
MSRTTLKSLRQEIADGAETRSRLRREIDDLRKLYSNEMGKRVDAQNELGRIQSQEVERRAEQERLAEEARTGIIKMGRNVCLCGACLEEAVLKLGPAAFYEVSVAPDLALLAKKLLRTYAHAHADNCFAPYVNLFVVPGLAPAGWQLAANGKTFRSAGCA